MGNWIPIFITNSKCKQIIKFKQYDAHSSCNLLAKLWIQETTYSTACPITCLINIYSHQMKTRNHCLTFFRVKSITIYKSWLSVTNTSKSTKSTQDCDYHQMTKKPPWRITSTMIRLLYDRDSRKKEKLKIVRRQKFHWCWRKLEYRQMKSRLWNITQENNDNLSQKLEKQSARKFDYRCNLRGG